MLKSFVYIVSVVSYITSISIANAEEYRQYGTHEHGLTQMNLALDEQNLHIEVISPAANIVGFEHQPQTPEESV
jgi:hypothetical protein